MKTSTQTLHEVHVPRVEYPTGDARVLLQPLNETHNVRLEILQHSYLSDSHSSESVVAYLLVPAQVALLEGALVVEGEAVIAAQTADHLLHGERAGLRDPVVNEDRLVARLGHSSDKYCPKLRGVNLTLRKTTPKKGYEPPLNSSPKAPLTAAPRVQQRQRCHEEDEKHGCCSRG